MHGLKRAVLLDFSELLRISGQFLNVLGVAGGGSVYGKPLCEIMSDAMIGE
jgi:hypothetical protein